MDRIAKIEIYQKDIPLKQTFVIALEEIRTASNLFVEITTEEGLVGWGESSPFPSITSRNRALWHGSSLGPSPAAFGAAIVASEPQYPAATRCNSW